MKHTSSHQKHLIVWSFSLLAIVILGTMFLAIQRRSSVHSETQARQQQEQRGRIVETALVKVSPTERPLTLMAETRSYYSVTLYARVSGYMDQLHVDIGDVVKKDQILAHVESPEQEQAYNSARADAFNKRRIANRTQVLRRRKLISPQQEEQAVSDAEVSEANLRTQSVVRGYQNITAPFDGVISNRFVDPGWLLQNASGSQSASQPLFTISQNDPLRIFVYVDQRDAPYVHVGDPVDIQLPNRIGEPLRSHVQMIAGELDSRTRTLLTELILPNPDRAVVPGSFVQVSMKVHTPQFFQLPVQALVNRKTEHYVPVVEANGTLRYSKIDLVENDGENILIRSGVKADEKVALNIGNSLQEGQKVQPVASGATSSKQAAGQAP